MTTYSYARPALAHPRYIALKLPIRRKGAQPRKARKPHGDVWISIFVWFSDLNKHLCFECCAGVRPVPLDIHVQGFDISNFESRMQARSDCLRSGALADQQQQDAG